ncbi:thioredoxin family protein [Martelella lutilitoris]|uniref:Thioredoxin family protein n=1 Tax=Martelella lutilitoris TaxID=2583532 RepID=A0A5C4JNH2_9HYPH|nr:thioredoxin family protein [Martelella lutilitoris]TNB46877.1 thioredoxin family protein [Martelella lutilitoris]
MVSVKIYGPGCKRCEATAKLVEEAAALRHVAVSLEKVTDPREIAMAGVMSTPGVAIDGRLVHAGGLPDRKKVEGWFAA